MSHINIEIKAKCFHPEKVEAFLLSNNARFIGLDNQKDTYFNVPAGRLKLRQGNIENSLIFYHRPDQEGPKQSDFSLSKVTDGPSTEQVLEKAMGIKVVVEKHRKIFFINNHYRLVKKYISSLKILLDKGFRGSKFQTI